MLMDQLLKKAKQSRRKVIAVAEAHDHEVIQAIAQAIKYGIADFILFGKKFEIEELLKETGLKYECPNVMIVEAESEQDSAKKAVIAVRTGEADILMKGMLQTSLLLKAVLHSQNGIRRNKLLSHIAVFDIPGYERFLLVTDSGMNIQPSLEQKVEIILNANQVAHALGVEQPKVALLAAVEEVNSKMEATVDAALLAKMNDRGQIKGCIVDGPLALDNAISSEAAKSKKIESPVAGDADILVVPTIEVGNALYKSLVFFAHARVGAIVTGAAAPIILTSRSDDANSKLFSIALAITSILNVNKV